MSFNDIFKSSFLENVTSISILDMVIAMVLAFAIGMFIFLVYKKTYQGVMYSSSFGVTLVALSMITTLVILAVTSNVVLSLGMVGALSIVRFRTAIKDPLDLMFLFWSISTGIICGAGYADYAFALAVILTIVVVVLDNLPVSKAPMILIVNANDIDLEDKILAIVKEYSKHYTVKSRNVAGSALTLTIEIATKKSAELVKKVAAENGVTEVSSLVHDGEVTF
jgi:hypothetical protein